VFGVVDFDEDIVAKGAFARSLASHKLKNTRPVMAWQHDARQIPGVWEEAFEDDYGLYLRGRLLKDDIAIGREAYALLKAGALSGLSVGMRVSVDEYDRNSGVRTIKEAELWEVSLVTFPANDLARVESVKNMKTVVDLERYLRQAEGMSRAEARQIVHDIKTSMRQACDRSELVQLIEKNIQLLEV
jgi:HK97 family phage prohead protease